MSCPEQFLGDGLACVEDLPPDPLLAANTRLVSMDAVNDIAGRGVAGYLVAPAIGEAVSPRAALAAGAAAIALVWIPILVSPLRKTRALAADGEADDQRPS